MAHFIQGNKHTWLALSLCMPMLMACVNRAEQAAAYNDRIITYENAIMDSFDRLDSSFADHSGSFEKLDYEFASLQAKIKQSKLAIDSIGPFRHDPNLQIAARQMFSSLDNLVENDYRKLITLVKLNDSLRVQPAIADSENVIRQRIQINFSACMTDFVTVQKEFGKKYNVTLK